jgi:hypothetical protein
MNAEQAWAALVTLEKAGHSLTKNIVDRIKQAIAGGGELDNYLAGKLQYELSKHNAVADDTSDKKSKAQPQKAIDPAPVEKPAAETPPAKKKK